MSYDIIFSYFFFYYFMLKGVLIYYKLVNDLNIRLLRIIIEKM